MAGLYLHIPFCVQACHYCDFHFSTQLDSKSEVIQAISSELVLQKEYLKSESLTSIYFGGGTPSILDESELNQLFEVILSNYSVDAGAEITLEANPDDLNTSKLQILRRTPVNRLSIGLQSFNDELLRFLNRAHTAQQAFDSLGLSRDAGFQNISIDLIFGIPGLSLDAWVATIRHALLLRPEHLSCYGLTIEPQTFFGKLRERGKFRPMNEEEEAEQYKMLMQMAGEGGYEHYEISNFARPGFRAVHNSNYWKHDAYLGVGPGAHSYNGNSRQFNVRNNAIYTRKIATGEIPCTKEVLSREDHINENVMTSLRTMEGCDLEQLRQQFGVALADLHKDFIDSLNHRGLANLAGDRLTLTPEGKCLADYIASELFVLPSTNTGPYTSEI